MGAYILKGIPYTFAWLDHVYAMEAAYCSILAWSTMLWALWLVEAVTK